jgi:hypothetical protein
MQSLLWCLSRRGKHCASYGHRENNGTGSGCVMAECCHHIYDFRRDGVPVHSIVKAWRTAGCIVLRALFNIYGLPHCLPIRHTKRRISLNKNTRSVSGKVVCAMEAIFVWYQEPFLSTFLVFPYIQVALLYVIAVFLKKWAWIKMIFR